MKTIILMLTFTMFSSAYATTTACWGKRSFTNKNYTSFIFLKVQQTASEKAQKIARATVSVAATHDVPEFERTELFRTTINMNGQASFDGSGAWTGDHGLEIKMTQDDPNVGFIDFVHGNEKLGEFHRAGEYHAQVTCTSSAY